MEMDRWQNKIAVVTGASAGIGAVIVKDLVKAGVVVVGLARRVEKVRDLKKDLAPELQKNLHAVQCDVSKEDEVKKVFNDVLAQFGSVDILVNNAGIVRPTELVAPDNTQPIREIIETNVMGVYYCTREAFNIMEKQKIAGHIVVINSVAGRSVPYTLGGPSPNMYPPSKHAITAMTEVYRREFNAHGTKVKITNISPGVVETEIFTDDLKKLMAGMPMLKAEDVSSAVLYAISTPPHVQIHELVIKPLGETF